jgi:hypothetical protein
VAKLRFTRQSSQKTLATSRYKNIVWGKKKRLPDSVAAEHSSGEKKGKKESNFTTSTRESNQRNDAVG